MKAHRPLGRLVVLALLLGGGATAPLLPAHAAESASVQGINGVLYQGCNYQSFKYDIPPEKAAYDWSLLVTAYDPRGIESTSAWLWKDEGDPPSGTASGENGLMICNFEPAGTYTLRAELNFYGGPYNDETLPESSFTMRKPYTRTRLRVNDKTAAYGQRLKFRIVSKAEYPRGYFANEYANVILQRRTPAGWRKIGRYSTNENGVAVARVRWWHRTPVPVRALTPRTSSYKASRSAPTRIR